MILFSLFSYMYMLDNVWILLEDVWYKSLLEIRLVIFHLEFLPLSLGQGAWTVGVGFTRITKTTSKPAHTSFICSQDCLFRDL